MRKFSEDYNEFFSTHKFSKVTVLGYDFQVVDAGSGKQTVVFLNGMDIYHSWIKYVSALENDYRVIMMNYPVEVSKNDEMADLLHALFGKLKIENLYCAASATAEFLRSCMQKIQGWRSYNGFHSDGGFAVC